MLTATTGPANALGVKAGEVVMELGWDSDADESLRAQVAQAVASDILDGDSDDVVDVVLLWWREDDGDLADGLMDAITSLTDQGTVWLLTPKSGRAGHIEAADIAEAAPIAGLQQTSTISASTDWQGTRLVSRRAKR